MEAGSSGSLVVHGSSISLDHPYQLSISPTARAAAEASKKRKEEEEERKKRHDLMRKQPIIKYDSFGADEWIDESSGDDSDDDVDFDVDDAIDVDFDDL
jgi:hypothetical protein